MNPSQPSTPRRDWRAEPPAPDAPGPRWRAEPDEPLPRLRRGKRPLRFALIGLFLGVLFIALIWVVLWLRPPKGTAVLIVTAGYEDNLAVPHNVYGRDGARALADLAGAAGATGESGRLRLPFTPIQLANIDDWDRDLSKARERTVLLFLALHGGADPEGAYLLPQDAFTPRDRERLDETKPPLRLQRVLDRLKKVPQDRHVVLVLDATQPAANGPAGMLSNTFARALDQLKKQIDDIPNLVVISASDFEQRSWPCEDLRRTIFTHYVIEGLKGHADGAVDGVADGQVDAGELHAYAFKRVKPWVLANRGALQEPALWPRGPEGVQRARAIHLTVVPRDVTPEEKPGPVFEPPESLKAEWRKLAALAREVPTPAAYSPHVWRQYRALLLRYEALLRAGAAEAARDFPARLTQLAESIRLDRALSLGAAGNTLAMQAAGGVESPPGAAAAQALNQLWDAPAEEHAKRWTEQLAKAGPGGGALRVQVLRLLVERVIEDPVRNLDRAARLIVTLDDPLSPRPAEAHDAVMFQRDLARDPRGALLLPGKYLEQALKVRVRGERAALGLPSPDQAAVPDAPYPYCAEVAPWVRARVADADKQRRLGHDLLFASAAESWDKGAKLLEQAEGQYRQAQEDALRVQAAHAARDEALAALPDYARWLGRRTLLEVNPRQREDGQLLDRVERLAGDAHALAALLEKREASPAGELAEQAKAVRRGLLDLAQDFGRHLSVVDDPDSPALWRALDDALAVPSIDPAARANLLGRQARLSRSLFLRAGGKEPAPLSPKTVDEVVRKSAEVQGRLAGALLGKRWFEEAGGLQRDTWAQFEQRLNGLTSAERWWESAARAGEEVGARWRLLPSEVAKRLSQGEKGAPPGGADDLLAADRLVRLVDAAGSVFVSRNPAAAYRKRLVQDLLLSQGGRTVADHWQAEDPVKVAYYRAAGRAYLDDVRRLDARDARLKGAEQELARAWRLKLELASAPGYRGPASGDPAALAMTSEDEFPLQYALRDDGVPVVPTGHPVVWFEPGSGLKALAPAPGQRMARDAVGGTDPALRCVVAAPLLRQAEAKPPDVPTTTETSLTARGLYRGQAFGLKTTIDLHPLAETVVTEHPLPLSGSLAVRSPRGVQAEAGAAKGAVAIVLDCSGSMAAPPGKPPTESKFAEAVDALRQLLQRVPRGTVVSVWVFGQATGDDAKPPRAEETIERVLDPTPWNPLDPARLNDLVTRLSALRPWNESPIVRAMWRAAKEDLHNADGFKTLLVITDGLDNRFQGDAYLNQGKKDIRTFLIDNFRDVEVDLIAFKTANGEGEKVREQFRAVAELPVPGKVYTVEESRDLVLKMQAVFRPRLSYRLDRDDGAAVTGPDGAPLDVSLTGANDRWLPRGLSPGSYRLRLVGAAAGREAVLNRGDALLAQVVPDRAGKLAFRRVLYSEEDHGLAPAKEEGDWRLATLQNQIVNDRRLEMLLTLEKKGELLAGPLRQVRPAKVWLEVAPPPDTSARFHRRWHYHAGYPAPAWSLEAPAWPVGQLTKSPAIPQVRVWWLPEEASGRAAPLPWKYDAGGQRVPANVPVTTGGAEAVIESVRVEQHLVETRPSFRDRPARREVKSCLVVRVRHGKENPVWVRPRGVEAAGQEHRYYSAAGKYTALFWPVTADQAGLGLTGLEVFSVASFKEEARKAGNRIEMLDLYEPQPGDARPLEPVELRLPDDPGGKGEPVPPPEPELLPPPPKALLAPAGRERSEPVLRLPESSPVAAPACPNCPPAPPARKEPAPPELPPMP